VISLIEHTGTLRIYVNLIIIYNKTAKLIALIKYVGIEDRDNLYFSYDLPLQHHVLSNLKTPMHVQTL